MSNPQPDIFVRWSKEHLDAMLRARMPATQMAIVAAVVRLTWGDRNRKAAPISIGTLAKVTGRNRSTVKDALTDLLQENVLLTTTARSSGRSRLLSVQKDYQKWGRYSIDPNDIPDFLRCAWEDGSDGTDKADQVGGQAHPTGWAGPPTSPDPDRGAMPPHLGGVCPPKVGGHGEHDQDNKTRQSTSSAKVRVPSETDLQAEEAEIVPIAEDEYDVSLQAEEAEILARTRHADLYRALAQEMAAANKTGAVSLSRVLRMLYRPLIAFEAEVSSEAMRYGLEAAVNRPAPAANYVKQAARGYLRQHPSHPGDSYQKPLSAADCNFFTDTEDRS